MRQSGFPSNTDVMPALAMLLCFVVGVADGDTLTARCAAADGDVTLQVRLAELDASEKGQAFGRRSKEHLATLCFGKSAVVTPTTWIATGVRSPVSSATASTPTPHRFKRVWRGRT
jgi:endonuclease YncB( thermonuclease family)